MEVFTLQFDGSCGPKNPGGTAAYGFILKTRGAYVTTGHDVIGTGPGMSNNFAEFIAVARGLEAFDKYCLTPALLNVRGDSNLVIKIMSGRWKARPDKLYYPAYVFAKEILTRIRRRNVQVNFDWIPREDNTECDDLSKVHCH